ncbi:ABC transporter substrate-binding protein [Desulfosporosinus youngiae]|uniref:ABC-type dipeptide transport system, periplasmic component n=1 Tax=Desulfosporosinus youngiae DSM 17734 TaxID=768710 RepID=H5Y452_9FIRM|nr:ABC transporter substrate-binding protein [Desulfosporosinus youngiae]EHQ89733.1 ABC-type dipeptide transport system, periplasmic component [Desulfosporosinus youngiae DSM 17734]
MKRRLRVLPGILLAMMLVLSLAGCQNSRTADGQGVNAPQDQNGETKPEVIRLAGGDTGLPNPFKHYMRGPGMSKMQLLYDSLLEKSEEGDIPWLAKSWDVSDDGRVYTFHLEEKALWHDGKPLTAEDVAFSFAYYKDHPPVSNDLIANGKYLIESTKVLDEHTVEIKLPDFDNTYLSKIGFTRILPKHIWEKVSDPLTYEGEGAGVGSGPFVMEEYNPEQGTYRYTAFPQYWGLKPAVAAIEWVPASDGVMAFENGEIDLINATADVLTRYSGKPEYKVATKPSYHSYRLMMNMEKRPELQDVNLRRALAYGIDRQELVDKVDRGSATVSSMGYVPPDSPWYNPDIEQYPFNIQKSKDLLAGKTYAFEVLTGNTAPEVKVAELIKLTLAQAGIDLTIKSVDSKVRDNAVKTGQYELLIINSGGMGGDPDYLRSIYGKQSSTAALNQQNLMGYQNERINALSQEQAVERDPAQRKDMIFRLQKLIAEDVPMIILQGAVDNYVYRPEKYDGWMFRYDHNKTDHNKLSYLKRS